MSGYFGYPSSSGGSGGGTSSMFGDLIPTDGTAAGFSDGTYLQPARVHDLDTSVNNEYNLGVNLRTYENGGSVEIGVQNNPLTVNLPNNYQNYYGSLLSNLFTRVELHNSYQINTNIYSSATNLGGSIVYDNGTGSINLQTDTTSGSSVTLMTNQFYKIDLGKTLILRQGIQFGSSGSNNSTNFGLFDNNYGAYFKLSNSLLSIGFLDTMLTGLTNEVSSINFNYDKFDGSGPSSQILDVTKYNLYEIRISWHGVLILDFFINGFLCHKMHNYNNTNKPFFQINKLPITIKLENSSSSTSTSLYYKDSSILLENGLNNDYYSFSAATNDIKTVSFVEKPILSIRSKNLINSIENRQIIIPKLLGIFTQGSRIKFKLLINPTLVGASFTSVDYNSSAEYDISATSFSGGDQIYLNYIATNEGSINLDLSSMFNLYGRNIKQNAFATSVDILTIIVASDSKISTRVSSTILWNEV